MSGMYDREYWAIRENANAELLGIIREIAPGLNNPLIRKINREHWSQNGWWFYVITKTEYETYRAFGIKDFSL